MARNAHPEVTRQRILDAAKSCSRKRGMSTPRFKIFSTSSKTSAKALSTIISKQRSDAACAGRFRQRTTSSPSKSRGWLAKRIAKLRNSLMMQITDAEHMTLMRDAFPLLNDPKILAENLRIWRTDSTKIAYDFIQEGLKDGSITTEYPQEAAELFHCYSITG